MMAVALAAVLIPLPPGSLAKPWTQWCTFPQLHRYGSGVLCLLAVGLGESMAVPGFNSFTDFATLVTVSQ